MSEFPALDNLPGNPVLVQSKKYQGRQHWKTRFFFLALLGTVILYHVLPRVFSWRHGFGFHYVARNDSPLKISTAEAQDVLDEVLSQTNLARNWSYAYTQERHMLGESQHLVDWTKEKFEEYDLEDTKVETYHVYLNTPVDHALNLLDKNGKVEFAALLEEDALPEDPTSQNDTVPTFHGYSASGNVTAQYFYANYGRKQDFDALRRLGIDMTGKIAIVRYGQIYRGLKVKFAQESGAVGVVIYSDPGDDGEFIPQNGYKTYPHGPARNPSSVERGSVMYLSYRPGDPTTPGYASKKGVPREDPHATTPKIPSLPVSYKDIMPILSKLNGLGPNAKHFGSDWVGKLEGFDYSIGLSPKGDASSPLLHLFNQQDYSIIPIHNVLGTTKGILEDEVVIVGNHRDAWIRGGAGDPNSGLAVMLEILRAFQEAAKSGFKPYRTIIWASWDGEEPGLLGLTEWAEDHARRLQKKVVAYLNLDSAVTGKTLLMSSSPVLKDVLFDVAKKVDYPKGGSLFDHYMNGPLKGDISILGSGSDYTVFLEHLGIPSFDIGFVSNPETEPVYQYHLNYDLFYWMDTICDPGFLYHNTMAKYFGKLVMQLSGPELLPFGVLAYGIDIEEYLSDALKSVPLEWYHYKSNTSRIPGHIHKTVASLSNLPELQHKTGFQFVNEFTEAVKITKKALKKFQRAGSEIDDARKHLQDSLYKKKSIWHRIRDQARVALINAKLGYLDRIFLHSDGLKDRPWFKHSIYASGRYTGYAGQSLPGFREAVEDEDPESALKWLNVYWRSLYVATGLLSI